MIFHFRLFRLMVLTIASLLAVCSAACWRSPRQQPSVPVRIGWQIPLATQGQIVQVLKRTDILSRLALDGKFIPFSYGGPQTEAALAGELDVIFVGDQPAVNLIARGGKWKIVSRLFYTKTAIMVPPKSPIHRIADLRDKVVATPFGSVAHREATLKQQAAGLDPDKDVRNVNLDILEISTAVQAGGGERWGKLDAVGVWEPTTSLFESRGFARVVDFTRTLGVVAVSEDFLSKNPDASVRLLEAILEAWAYFAMNHGLVNQWYIDDAELSYTGELLDKAAAVEPNYAARSLREIDLNLEGPQVSILEAAARWSFERGFSKGVAPIETAVDLSALEKAQTLVQGDHFSVEDIKVLQ